jgi:hypothetical protein
MEEDGDNAGATLLAEDTVQDTTVQDTTQDAGQDETHVPPATHHVEADTDLPLTTTEQEAIKNEAEGESVNDEVQENVVQQASPEMEQPIEDDVAEQERTPSDGPTSPPERRASARIIAGVRKPTRFCYHTSVKKALNEHGKDAYDAIIKEFKQLFKEKKALIPVNRGDLSARQIKQIIRSSMFLKTKFDAKGIFEKN